MSKWPHQAGRLALILFLMAFFGIGWVAFGFVNTLAATVAGLAAGFLVGNCEFGS